MTTQTEERILALEAENERLDRLVTEAARRPPDVVNDNQYGDEVAKVRPTFGYYRQPDGWITASPSTNTDELQYRRNGWEPLKQYGMFEMGTVYMVSHPLEPLFIRGGAHELTADQIIKQGLYQNPPLIPTCRQALGQTHKRHQGCFKNAQPVKFPQIAHLTDLGPFVCSFGCGRQLPTKEARSQHESVMHAPEKSDERTGRSLADALLAGGVKSPAGESAAISALVAHMERLERELVALKAPVRRRGPNKAKVPA